MPCQRKLVLWQGFEPCNCSVRVTYLLDHSTFTQWRFHNEVFLIPLTAVTMVKSASICSMDKVYEMLNTCLEHMPKGKCSLTIFIFFSIHISISLYLTDNKFWSFSIHPVLSYIHVWWIWTTLLKKALNVIVYLWQYYKLFCFVKEFLDKFIKIFKTDALQIFASFYIQIIEAYSDRYPDQLYNCLYPKTLLLIIPLHVKFCHISFFPRRFHVSLIAKYGTHLYW